MSDSQPRQEVVGDKVVKRNLRQDDGRGKFGKGPQPNLRDIEEGSAL